MRILVGMLMTEVMLGRGAVWVDFGYSGTESGTCLHPYNTLTDGISAVPPGGPVNIKAGLTSVHPTIATPCSPLGGAVAIS
jgi:hypothetical protein